MRTRTCSMASSSSSIGTRYLDMQDKQDLVSGSFNYGLGNVGGGFIGGDRTLINWLRQTARPYLIGEPLAPINAAMVLKVIDLLEKDDSAMGRLQQNAKYLKDKIALKGWRLIFNEHPIVSIVVGGTLRVQKMVEYLFEKDLLVSGLCYPNTPEGAALIRIQVSANHTVEQMDRLIEALDEAMHFIE